MTEGLTGLDVLQAAQSLERRGLLRRRRDCQADLIVDLFRERFARAAPADLQAFYREGIDAVGDYRAVLPWWNDYVGWKGSDKALMELAAAEAVPLFGDGCGNLFGLDLTPGNEPPAVYFFDHDHDFAEPEYAAGSTLAKFLLLLGESQIAFEEGRADGWELAIDPNIANCPRAAPVWLA